MKPTTPFPVLRPIQGGHPQPQPQEHAYMTARGFAPPTSDSIIEHQQSHPQPQQKDTQEETIRALRGEVEALHQARQPKHTPGGNTQLIEQLARLFERSNS